MKAIVVEAGQLIVQDVPSPIPLPNQAIVRVAAISLNRGEMRYTRSAHPVARPGWDFAGVIEQAAADGMGFAIGTRVVGLLRAGAWAEQVAVSTEALAALPEAVSFAQAATLPVAGLTAYHALWQGGLLLDRPILITGASGSVGNFACQLAALSGARIVGVMRNPSQAKILRDVGLDEMTILSNITQVNADRYHLIVESVGGESLAKALTLLQRNGTCVSLGASAADDCLLDIRQFFLTGGTKLYGLALFDELRREAASIGLARLVSLVAKGKLKPRLTPLPMLLSECLTVALSEKQYCTSNH
jgi:NADPH:quinone reductase